MSNEEYINTIVQELQKCSKDTGYVVALYTFVINYPHKKDLEEEE